MYSDKQFADEICRIVDPKDVHTGAQIIQLVEEKFKSTNTQSTAIAQIADDIGKWAKNDGVARVNPSVFRKWERQLRAL